MYAQPYFEETYVSGNLEVLILLKYEYIWASDAEIEFWVFDNW